MEVNTAVRLQKREFEGIDDELDVCRVTTWTSMGIETPTIVITLAFGNERRRYKDEIHKIQASYLSPPTAHAHNDAAPTARTPLRCLERPLCKPSISRERQTLACVDKLEPYIIPPSLTLAAYSRQ